VPVVQQVVVVGGSKRSQRRWVQYREVCLGEGDRCLSQAYKGTCLAQPTSLRHRTVGRGESGWVKGAAVAVLPLAAEDVACAVHAGQTGGAIWRAKSRLDGDESAFAANRAKE